MLRATEKITALYCRLSVEYTKDEKKNSKEDPSNSIQHQQVMLMQYAKANRLPNPTCFIDDGYSGVTYYRPGFQKMLSEIEAGNVGTVITKDLSRLGRNSALLEKEKVLNPTAYKQREGRKTPHQTPDNEYRWHESTVAYILEYMEYTGREAYRRT